MLLGINRDQPSGRDDAIAALPFRPTSQPILPQPSPTSKNWNHAIIRGSPACHVLSHCHCLLLARQLLIRVQLSMKRYGTTHPPLHPLPAAFAAPPLHCPCTASQTWCQQTHRRHLRTGSLHMVAQEGGAVCVWGGAMLSCQRKMGESPMLR